MSSEKKHIVIVGAGFGGITATIMLARYIKPRLHEYELILIDRHHHQLYTPALYEIATIPRMFTPDVELNSSILIPIADIIKGKPITFLCDELIGIDVSQKRLTLKQGNALLYEFLILALGSETNYFDIPGLKEQSLPLKTFDDAIRLRNHIEEALYSRKILKIVVGGGGSTGVELIAELVNFVCALQEKISHLKICAVEFLLIEASPEILPGFSSWIVEKAEKRLAFLGIQIKTGVPITAVSPHLSRETMEARQGVLMLKDGTTEPYDILIWAGGVKGPEVFRKFGLALSNKGSAVVNEYLEVQGADSTIFAIGDNATFTHPATGKPLVWNASAAEAQGKLVAKNIFRRIRGGIAHRFKSPEKYPFILAVGKKYAIADFVFFHFSGFWGWIAKLLIELRYLLFILPLKKALRDWWLSVHIYSSND